MPGQNTIAGRTAIEIAASVERAVRRGQLRPGEHLPPIRALAADLAASHVTVATAYRRLRERGLVVGAGRAGTRVAARPPLPVQYEVAVPAGVRDLTSGNPDPALLPPLPHLEPEQVLYGVEPKDERLVALVGAAFRADGIDADHITIVSGALDGIERVLGAALRPGDRVAVEDPAFPRVLDLLAALGLRVEGVRIDEAGIRPEALERALGRGVDGVILTPRAQNPGAAALDPERAAQLRGVLAAHPEVLVIEDDHAAGIAGAPAASVCGGRERWAVVRSFAKGLGPDLRVAALAGDEVTVARVEGRQLLGIGWVSRSLQRTVAAMLADHRTRKRLARTERVYGERRQALVEALAAHGIGAWGRSGLNVWVPVPEETVAVASMLAAGYAVAPGERFRLASGPGVRLTTATLEPGEAPAVSAALARAVRGGRRTFSA
ncbi:MAG: aminotransferase class I/II-fold pyridoxal phosphate-dependent enzyme [Actinomycetota bacterium]|nr:aminotransferase class I/II-fold pyridoxal phosphate-dependent enzyme [Actinomycetota bacterium]